MKRKHWYSVAIAALITTLLLTATIFFPSLTVFANEEGKYGRIGNVPIDDKKDSVIKSQLATEIVKWKEKDVEIVGVTARVTIPSELIKFEIDDTVDTYKKQSSSPWYMFWSKGKQVDIPLEVTLDEKVNNLMEEASFFYADETIEALKEHVGYLRDGYVEAAEVPITKEEMARLAFEIEDVVVDGQGLSQIVDLLSEVTIGSGESFSLLEQLKEVSGYVSDETKDFFASTLYAVVLQSELTIQERHSQNVLPAYAQPGREAKLDEKRNIDFAFLNNTERPFILSTALEENRLKISLYSVKSPYEVTVNITGEEVKPRTIYRLDADVPAGQQRIEKRGENGVRVKVYRNMNERGGAFEKDTLIAQDFYPPKSKVVAISSEQPISNNSNSENSSSDKEDTSKQDEESADDSNKDSEGSKDNSNKGTDSGSNGKDNSDRTDEVYPGKDREDEELSYDKGGNIIERRKSLD